MNYSKSAFNSLSLALAFLCSGVYSPAIGQVSSDTEFTLNLNNADVYALIKTVSDATGRNFVVDPRVSGRVTVISTTPVNAEKLYEMFLSVLQVHGFSAVPAGDLTKIVPDFAARQGPVPVLGNNTGTRDQLVSQVIPIVHVPVEPLVPILRPMVPQEGQLAANVGSNSLLVTDRAANIERLMEIIRLMDVPDRDEVDSVHLSHASAADVVRTLLPLQNGSGGGNSPTSTQLVADERTNSILISGNQAARARMRRLIKGLDSPVDSGGNTRVVFLNFADAEEIAEIVRDESFGALDSTSDQPTFTPNVNNDSEEDDDERDALASGTFATGGGGSGGGSRVRIRTDENTNSLIITAPPAEMATILAIIERLDIRRAQVMVEAVIAEISEDNIRELGINFLLDATGNGGPAGFTNLDGATGRLLAGVDAVESGNAPSLESGLSLALGNFASDNINFGSLFNAIASDADNNVLSTPTIVALDNEEAEIVVGTNVPFITGQQLSDDNDNPFQTIERRDVGLRLKVTPQINEGDTIRLELEQEVSTVNATAITGAADITTNTRSITTTVLVEDGQTLVLGGLNDDIINDVVEKVPVLGDIPVIGRLFQFKSKTKSKSNLVILLHPVILRDKEVSDRITNTKFNKVRSEQLLSQQDGTDSKEEFNKIPELNIVLKKKNVPGNSSLLNNSRAVIRPRKKIQPTTSISPLGNSSTAPNLDLESQGYRWVEMPDGSFLFKRP